MKKILVLLLALMAFGAVVYAADAPAPVLTFGQYSDIETDYNADGFVQSVYNETYFNFKASDMGFSATTVSGTDFFATPRNYKLYYNAFNGMLSIAGGKLREGPARLASYIDGNGFSTRLANVYTGLMFTVKPIAALTAAVFLPVTAPVAPAVADDTSFSNLNFGVQYNLDKVANVVAGYRMQNKELWVGADIKAIANVTAKAGFKMISGGDNYVYLTGAFAGIENVDLGLDADVVLASTLGYGVKVLASYAMAPYTFGVKISYDNGSDAWYAANGVVANPFVQWDFAKGDIKIGFSYDTGASTWVLPIEFELSY